jgi:CHAT domain-containing protein
MEESRDPSLSTPTPQSYEVEIRYGRDESVALVLDDKAFYPTVKRWQYVVSNRQRMTNANCESLAHEALDMLCGFARDDPSTMPSTVALIGAAGLVEVRVPYQEEKELGWAAQQFPWETALSLVTRPYRATSGRAFTVLRHLDGAPFVQTPREDSALIACSSPGAIGERYRLDEECAMVRKILDQSGISVELLSDPDRNELFAGAVNRMPTIIHLAGIDPAVLHALGLAAKVDPRALDGFVLKAVSSSSGKQEYDMVSPTEMAQVTTAAPSKPTLVSFSSCYSAARMAALCVAHGAHHAIGFQDTVIDADAILFFTSFYRAWGAHREVLSAFREARLQWMRQSTMPSAPVVLWSSRSLLRETAPVAQIYGKALASVGVDSVIAYADSAAAGAGTVPTGATAGPAALTPLFPSGSPPSPAQPPTPAATVDDLHLVVELNPDRMIGGRTRASTSLNYSLLHNDRTPFSTFLVEKSAPGKLPPLQVEVSLEVGAEPCRCRFSEELPESGGTVVLASRIRLPLVASLLRKCTESLRTNLYIRVSCGDRLLRETSEKITILPADEWRDDGDDHRWLPCFVLPRDPAVLKLIDAAQRYLRTLLDDCSAGFDGYQRISGGNAAHVVDPQVQAIWAALQHDLPLSYINPPPSYTTFSQRLRTPTEVFRGQSGTCIDLALLFASCLEFVGIYPVIFLIRGHAFPGYWRSDEGWWRLSQFNEGAATALAPESAAPLSSAALSEARTSAGQPERWLFSLNTLGELMRYVQEGSLVPFESTFVTRRLPYSQALETGVGNLHPATFDAMLDVQTARCDNVTPLPIFDSFH